MNLAPSLNTFRDQNDVDRYMIRCRCSGIFGSKLYYWLERDDADCDRQITIDHIKSGEVEGVVQVICFNSFEHTCTDVTEDIARAIADSYSRGAGDTCAGSIRDFIEHQLGWEYIRDVPQDMLT